MEMQTQAPTTEPQLCQRLGFDAQARRERLSLMGLDDADIPILLKIQQHTIQPQCQHLLEAFYDFLFGFAEMRTFLGSQENIQRLKTTQMEYLHSFGLQIHDAAYFEYRLRIGITHERIGMPLHLYLAAYRTLQTLIQDALPADIRLHPQHCFQYFHSINKIVMLDMSLAIDAYSRTRVELMSESLQTLAHEREVLSSQLMRDTLTGTLSRRFILEMLNKQLAQLARQPNKPLNVALLDLDHFKQINDTWSSGRR